MRLALVVQQPDGVSLQKYPKTRLLLILVGAVVLKKYLDDAQLVSLSVLSYLKMGSKMATP